MENLCKFSDELANNTEYKYYSKTQISQLYEYLSNHGIDTNVFSKNPPHPSKISDIHPTFDGNFGVRKELFR